MAGLVPSADGRSGTRLTSRHPGGAWRAGLTGHRLDTSARRAVSAQGSRCQRVTGGSTSSPCPRRPGRRSGRSAGRRQRGPTVSVARRQMLCMSPAQENPRRTLVRPTPAMRRWWLKRFTMEELASSRPGSGRPAVNPGSGTGPAPPAPSLPSAAPLTHGFKPFPCVQKGRSSPGWTRTNNPPVNSRMLCQLSYRGRQRGRSVAVQNLGSRAVAEASKPEEPGDGGEARGSSVRRTIPIVVAAALALAWVAPAVASQSASVAALQVALRWKRPLRGARRRHLGPDDAVHSSVTFSGQTGSAQPARSGMPTRCKLGKLGLSPCSVSVRLATGRVGWDVASLEFKLRGFGLPAKRVDGRFDAATAAALRRLQRARGLRPDGIAGAGTYRALARGAHAAARKPARPPRAFGRGLRRHRPSLPGCADRPRPRERPAPDERVRPRSTAAHPGPHRGDKARRRPQASPGVAGAHPRARRAAGGGIHRDRRAVRCAADPARECQRPRVDERDRAGPAAADSRSHDRDVDARGEVDGLATSTHRRRRRELLLDLPALPRQPVARWPRQTGSR